MALQHNAVVTVVFEVRSGGRYGQAAISDVMNGAQATARDIIGKLH
jgi:ATP-dependent protease HslVU (ClpYQ) peptidase subunit